MLVLADAFRVCRIVAYKLQINLFFAHRHNERFLGQPTTGTASYKHTHKHTGIRLKFYTIFP